MPIYEVKQVKFKFQKIEGYNVPLTSTIRAIREMMGDDGCHDVCAVIHFGTNGTQTPLIFDHFNRSLNPRMRAYRVINEKLLRLKDGLEKHSSDAIFNYCSLSPHFYALANEEAAVIYVKCRDGVIGAAWYDYGHNRTRALKMSAALCYLMGLINVEDDETLWSSSVENLGATDLMIDAKEIKAILSATVRKEAHLTGEVVIREIDEKEY